ncbi:FxLYD domain-containing protein [Paenibacillus sp. HB172176]|uniref:FxLYD domain-containing protein n=1 Tax=Paenibacillus sp. HB172176 TaxID=2493690 RepID=UPI0014398298|nr:FxLYD domain-containing protein [Paenibacillus sp. HB172176]
MSIDWTGFNPEASGLGAGIEQGENAAGVERMHSDHHVETMRPNNSWLLSFGLMSLAIIVAASVWTYYRHERNINERVLKLQTEAKAFTLAGKYQSALDTLAEADELRPEFESLHADEEVVQHVSELNRLLNDVESRLSLGSLEEAERGLNHLKSEFNGHKEPAYTKQRQRLEDLDMKLTIMQMTSEVPHLTTLKQYTDMLNVVNGIMGDEASALREQIIQGIRELTTRQVDGYLGKRNYNDALSSIRRALVWVKQDEQLLEMQSRVKEQQADYEASEQQRIEQAMKSAAEEDLINQTDAVEVIGTDKTLDEFGDLTITGTMKSVATRPIYDVTVEYKVANASGELLESGTATVTPNYIEPGEEMSFTATIYGVYSENVVIEVGHAKWYLD